MHRLESTLCRMCIYTSYIHRIYIVYTSCIQTVYTYIRDTYIVVYIHLAKTTTEDYSIYGDPNDEKECEKPSRYFMSKIRAILRFLIPSDGIGHILTQSVGYAYQRQRGMLSVRSSKFSEAGRIYWERQTRRNDYSVIFGVQLALNSNMIDWDCCFRHDFARRVVSPQSSVHGGNTFGIGNTF